MKVENFLDKMCQRVAAALLIQKVYKGFQIRRKVIGMKIRESKRNAFKHKSSRIIFELLT